MTSAITTHELTKFYGRTRGIEDVDLEVREGEVFGFLGPNGAGKSTTIRVLLDFIRPTKGAASVLGLDARRDSIEIKRRVGYLPGELAMYEKMTARELFGYFAGLRGMSDLGDAEALSERLELDPDIKIRKYSTGNRQKVGLVQAMMHRPELLILDEPTGGLDPLIQAEVHRVIDEVRSDGRTVFLSSHVLPEVERVADRVGIIRRGHLVVVDDVAEIKRHAVRKLILRFGDPVDPDVFGGLPAVVSVHALNEHEVEVAVEGSVDPVIKKAAEFETTSVTADDGDLEAAFLSFYADEGEAVP
ncbi:MAG: ABC transporter ATP-binding protein [Acidimicrobiia bacterium]|nr:ABC transporter ATP-binding protein [Acidimicrobiia bacterium]